MLMSNDVTYCTPTVLDRKIFKGILLFKLMLNFCLLLWPRLDPRSHNMNYHLSLHVPGTIFIKASFNDALSLHFVIFGIMVLRRKIFKDIQKIFAIDQLYLLAWHYVCINLNPNHTGLLCVRFGWNWPKDLKRWKCEKFGQGRPIDKFWLKNFWLMWANILSKSILTTKLV